MKLFVAGAACALSFAAFAEEAAPAAKKPAPAAKQATSLTAADLKWGDAPPSFPKGAQLAMLHGDPSKKAQFALRFKMPDGYKIPPHWHTNDERS